MVQKNKADELEVEGKDTIGATRCALVVHVRDIGADG